MARRITVDVSELSDEIEDITQEELTEIANTLVNQLKLEAPTDTGDLQDLIQIWREKPGRIVITMPTYGKHVQEGTEPPPQGPKPVFEDIEKWARRKLNDESAAGPVFSKLMSEGQDKNAFVDRALNNTMERFR